MLLQKRILNRISSTETKSTPIFVGSSRNKILTSTESFRDNQNFHFRLLEHSSNIIDSTEIVRTVEMC